MSVVLLNSGSRLYRGDALGELERAGLGTDPLGRAQGRGRRRRGPRRQASRRPLPPPLRARLAGSAGQPRRCASPRALRLRALERYVPLGPGPLEPLFRAPRRARHPLPGAPPSSREAGEQLPSAVSPGLQPLEPQGAGPQLAGRRTGPRASIPSTTRASTRGRSSCSPGGFDPGLANPYWQKLDFGFRAWLWGEEIRVAQALKVSYAEAPDARGRDPRRGLQMVLAQEPRAELPRRLRGDRRPPASGPTCGAGAAGSSRPSANSARPASG